MKIKKVRNVLVATALTCSMTAVPVFATPSATELEQQKRQTESEVNDLQSQLNSLITKMNELEGQLIEKGQEIAQAQQDLEAAEEKEKQQYEDLKLRIKYMYEEGDNSAMERILASGSIAEMLTQADYVQKVHTYDRKQLEEYQQTVEEVKELKTTLESDMENLQTLEEEYKAQSDELETTIEGKRTEIDNLDGMIQEAARKAEEERLAKEEAERQKQAEEQAKRNNGNTGVAENPTNGGNDNNQGTNNGGGDNSGTPTITEPTYNPSTGNAIVDRAYSKLGYPYVWGAYGPDSFDCSGFVSYCLSGSYIRLGTTYTFLGYQQVSDPQPGDICVNAGHCGIYIGGGQMIHAATEGVGVIIGPVQGGMIYVRY